MLLADQIDGLMLSNLHACAHVTFSMKKEGESTGQMLTERKRTRDSFFLFDRKQCWTAPGCSSTFLATQPSCLASAGEKQQPPVDGAVPNPFRCSAECALLAQEAPLSTGDRRTHRASCTAQSLVRSIKEETGFLLLFVLFC